jgi:hypothetical protein
MEATKVEKMKLSYMLRFAELRASVLNSGAEPIKVVLVYFARN